MMGFPPCNALVTDWLVFGITVLAGLAILALLWRRQ